MHGDGDRRKDLVRFISYIRPCNGQTLLIVLSI
jgi:hypothetical protein